MSSPGPSLPAAAPFIPAPRYPDPAVQVLGDSFARYRLALAKVERLASGLRWAERPVWSATCCGIEVTRFADPDLRSDKSIINDKQLRGANASALPAFRKLAVDSHFISSSSRYFLPHINVERREITIGFKWLSMHLRFNSMAHETLDNAGLETGRHRRTNELTTGAALVPQAQHHIDLIPSSRTQQSFTLPARANKASAIGLSGLIKSSGVMLERRVS